MRTKSVPLDPQLRLRLAQTSARIMIQEHLDDYYLAKCKAAAQLGVSSRCLPSNNEVETEIVAYHRLFPSESHIHQLYHLRQTALEAMRLFAVFSPRLVGSVLHGTANKHSDVILHLFTDTPENVAVFLMEHHVPYELNEWRFRLPQVVSYPSYQFVAGETSIVLIVFGTNDIRWSPPSPVDGKPMRRADLRAVEQLLQATNDHD